jgi:hypothetical protein
MANVRCGNSCYVDSTGYISATGSKQVKVAYITFTSDAAADTITFKDASTSGALKMTVKSAVADETVVLDFSTTPLVFPNGIYVSAISANCTATIITTTGGGD